MSAGWRECRRQRSRGLHRLLACRCRNVLKDARTRFAGIPLHCVLGGLHLSGPTEKIIPDTVEAMREFELAYIAAGHCTGWRAMTALVNAFGDQIVTPTAVGK